MSTEFKPVFRNSKCVLRSVFDLTISDPDHNKMMEDRLITIFVYEKGIYARIYTLMYFLDIRDHHGAARDQDHTRTMHSMHSLH